MHEIKITCENCGCWIGRMPNVIGNYLKSRQIAIDAGWLIIWVTKPKRGRNMAYCPSCANKTTVKQMVGKV